jgi:hypothetical protein
LTARRVDLLFCGRFSPVCGVETNAGFNLKVWPEGLHEGSVEWLGNIYRGVPLGVELVGSLPRAGTLAVVTTLPGLCVLL